MIIASYTREYNQERIGIITTNRLQKKAERACVQLCIDLHVAYLAYTVYSIHSILYNEVFSRKRFSGVTRHARCEMRTAVTLYAHNVVQSCLFNRDVIGLLVTSSQLSDASCSWLVNQCLFIIISSPYA